MKKHYLFFYLLLSTLHGYSQNKDTFQVYFPFNKSALTRESENYIDALIFNDTLIHGDKLIVLGYTDYVGGNDYNEPLSRERAKNVCNYLISSGFEKQDIKLFLGKGKVERNDMTGKQGYAPDRKVQIIVDHAKTVEPPKPAIVKQQKPSATPDFTKEKIDPAQIKVNQTFALNHIIFQPGLPVLLPESEPELKKLLGFLKDNASVKIRIEGHVCCLGPNPGNQARDDGNLSEMRALDVYKYLADRGIDTSRLKCAGLGNANPVVANEVTEEDRIKNRRVEIRIISK